MSFATNAVRTDGTLAEVDPEVAAILSDEESRQRSTLALIASENYASVAVRQASGSILTNKYSEGYPGKRYYAGNEWVDAAEALAIQRVKELLGAEHANVQPHAGSQANMAAYFATLNPGDTVLAMELAQGGHLTHGAGFNFSGKLYRFVHYGVRRDTETLDYDEIEAIARREKPQLIVAGATAYPRMIDFARFRQIADAVDARLMVDMAHIAGLVAAGFHPSPVPHADIVTFTTHKTMRGPRGGAILSRQDLARKVDSAVFPGLQGGPLDHAIAAKAVAFKELPGAGRRDGTPRRSGSLRGDGQPPFPAGPDAVGPRGAGGIEQGRACWPYRQQKLDPVRSAAVDPHQRPAGGNSLRHDPGSGHRRDGSGRQLPLSRADGARRGSPARNRRRSTSDAG